MNPNTHETKHYTCFFLPVRTEEKNYSAFTDSLQKSGWSIKTEHPHYLLRYVFENLYGADRLEEKKREQQCMAFSLTDQGRRDHSIPDAEQWLAKHIPIGQAQKHIRFQIVKTELFCFRTGIHVFCFQIAFESHSLSDLAEAEFWLKQMGASPEGQKEPPLLLLAQQALENEAAQFSLDFFHYWDKSQRRANYFTYVETETETGLPSEFSRELFYLRWGYRDVFRYRPDGSTEPWEIHETAQDLVWGISPEALTCICYPTDEAAWSFTENVLRRNIQNNYRFLYVLLLHQKYALFDYLTEINTANCDNLKELESYEYRLSKLEADYMYSVVSEVPQYQQLYEKISSALAIPKLYEDVRGPLTRLEELRRKEKDEEKQRESDKMNFALAIISILTLFSAFADSYAFFADVQLPHGERGVLQWISLFVILALFLLSAGYIIRYWWQNKERRKKK